MEKASFEEVIAYLKKNRILFHDKFGITRMGIFGSFARGEQTPSSDIDMVVEMSKEKKNIHNFLEFKRLIEREMKRKVDMGFERFLKTAVREKIKKQIIYV